MSSVTNNTLCPICYINKPTIGCTTCKYILCKECSDKLQKMNVLDVEILNKIGEKIYKQI